MWANHINCFGKKLVWLTSYYGANFTMETKFQEVRLFLSEIYPEIANLDISTSLSSWKFVDFIKQELKRLNYPYSMIEKEE